MTRDDEFYIGYDAVMPPELRRRVGLVVAVLLLAVVGLSFLLMRVQRPLAASTFEFGRERRWTGFLISEPAPALLVPSSGGHTWFWLVGRGKHGADAALHRSSRGWVEITGTLISREGWRMIEIASASPAAPPGGGSPDPAPPASGGEPTMVRGEIVDSKCFLGVMNPGERVVHRDCAIRCLSGGVPPMIAFRDERDQPELAVLVDAGGRSLHDTIRDFVGRPVVASGRLFRINGQAVLQLGSFTGASQ